MGEFLLPLYLCMKLTNPNIKAIFYSVSVGSDCIDKTRYSDDPIALMQMFEQHEDIIIDLNEVRIIRYSRADKLPFLAKLCIFW